MKAWGKSGSVASCECWEVAHTAAAAAAAAVVEEQEEDRFVVVVTQ